MRTESSSESKFAMAFKSVDSKFQISTFSCSNCVVVRELEDISALVIGILSFNSIVNLYAY